jgi:hypothetical protein
MVAHALDALGLGFRFAEGRQEHSGKDRYDRDDDEQLD